MALHDKRYFRNRLHDAQEWSKGKSISYQKHIKRYQCPYNGWLFPEINCLCGAFVFSVSSVVDPDQKH